MSDTPWIKWYPADFLNGIAELSPHEIAVYTVVLNRIYDEDGPIPDEPQKLARRCNMRLPHFQKALDALIEDGKLVREDGLLCNLRARKEIVKRHERNTKQTSNVNKRWQKEREKANKINDGPIPPNNGRDTKPIPTRSQKPESDKEKYKKEFDEWYQAFPRHVGRGQAERAYRTARKKAGADVLLAAAVDYAGQRAGEDAKFTKHPATWLNGECWLDAVDAPPEHAGNGSAPYRTAADNDAMQRRARVKVYGSGKLTKWSDDWGPPPSEAEIAAVTATRSG